MVFKLILVVALALVVAGRPQQQEENYPPAQYAFKWDVEDQESGNSYGQEESRDGDNTQGRYEVLLPDQRRQIVVYSVTADGGFNADVTYV